MKRTVWYLHADSMGDCPHWFGTKEGAVAALNSPPWNNVIRRYVSFYRVEVTPENLLDVLNWDEMGEPETEE